MSTHWHDDEYGWCPCDEEGEWCICVLDPGHGPTPHKCRCGKTWGIGMASPEHESVDSETES